MSNDILAIIPARAGSKGIKNKNTKLINGKPLISYAIDFAKKSKLIDKIVISSDDSKISKLYKDTNIDFIERPKDLCRDDSLVIDAIRYTIDHLKQKCVAHVYSPLVFAIIMLYIITYLMLT